MKKLMCLLVVFFISNAANAADQWEYVSFEVGQHGRHMDLTYPDGKEDYWSNKTTKPPKNFKAFSGTRLSSVFQKEFDAMLKKDFSKPINVINALGLVGFEMCGIDTHTERSFFYFKRKNK